MEIHWKGRFSLSLEFYIHRTKDLYFIWELLYSLCTRLHFWPIAFWSCRKDLWLSLFFFWKSLKNVFQWISFVAFQHKRRLRTMSGNYFECEEGEGKKTEEFCLSWGKSGSEIPIAVCVWFLKSMKKNESAWQSLRSGKWQGDPVFSLDSCPDSSSFFFSIVSFRHRNHGMCLHVSFTCLVGRRGVYS